MINSEQQVQIECTTAPVVPAPLHGWIQARVYEPVTRARARIDDVQTNGQLDQLIEVKADLDAVKESCQNIKKEICEHNVEMTVTKQQLEEQKQINENMKKQREMDQATNCVQIALLRATFLLEIEKVNKAQTDLKDGLKEVKTNVEEKQVQTDCALKELQEKQRRTSDNLNTLETKFDTSEAKKEREERRMDRRSRASSSLEQSLEASYEDRQSRNEALQFVRNKEPEEPAPRFRLDSGVSLTSNASFQLDSTLSIPEIPPTNATSPGSTNDDTTDPMSSSKGGVQNNKT